jgi:ArsR family metal-binding transcriptional regulator
MLLKSYSKEIFRAKCNPSFESLHCLAHLNEDISDVIPYLNASLGGFECVKDPPSVTFKVHGKLITVHARQIAVNALKDEEEADKILRWLQKEINEAWDKRNEIQPTFEPASRPSVLEILKLLPKINCGACGEPTCMVFAVQVAGGTKEPEDCRELPNDKNRQLRDYLGRYHFDAL